MSTKIDYQPQSKAAWKERLTQDLKNKTYEDLKWQTLEGFSVEPLYTAEELRAKPHMQTFHAWMNALKNPGWSYFQPMLQGQALDMNQVKALGATGVLLFENEQLSTQIEQASQAGLAVGLILRTPISNEKLAELQVELIQKNSWILADGISWYVQHQWAQEEAEAWLQQAVAFPEARIGFDGSAYHLMGANATQELAAMLSGMVAAIHAGTSNGLELKDLASRILFSTQVGPLFFMEIAKLRALRLLVWNLFAIYEVEPFEFPLHVSTSALFWSGKDAEMNLLRHTTEAASGILGGADQISILPYTIEKTYRQAAEKLSLDLSLLLAEEAHLDKTVDAAGGSFYIDQLTDLLAENAWNLFQELEEKGGILEEGKALLLKHIQETASKREDMLKRGELELIGVNKFESETAKHSPYFQEFSQYKPLYQLV